MYTFNLNTCHSNLRRKFPVLPDALCMPELRTSQLEKRNPKLSKVARIFILHTFPGETVALASHKSTGRVAVTLKEGGKFPEEAKPF